MPIFNKYPVLATWDSRRWFLRTFKKGVCKTFHDHPRRFASSVSLALLEDARKKPYRRNLGIGSISESQLHTVFWDDGKFSPASSQSTSRTTTSRMEINVGANTLPSL
jgi:hypothetical protein